MNSVTSDGPRAAGVVRNPVTQGVRRVATTTNTVHVEELAGKDEQAAATEEALRARPTR